MPIFFYILCTFLTLTGTLGINKAFLILILILISAAVHRWLLLRLLVLMHRGSGGEQGAAGGSRDSGGVTTDSTRGLFIKRSIASRGISPHNPKTNQRNPQRKRPSGEEPAEHCFLDWTEGYSHSPVAAFFVSYDIHKVALLPLLYITRGFLSSHIISAGSCCQVL